MATIKAIDTSTVHRIQSSQVIVDICSVVKELIENSVDAGATSLDLRFKNQGLDSIEVQDNGSGISPENYAGVGLKHHTSKLSSYEDISNLQTFGFRGEALSSLCALSNVSVITCRTEDVPKGAKLKFNTNGVLEDTSVVAAQRGTTVIVENLFHNLPVRRKELERNIKREWNKLIALLNQYACIQTNLKFTVSQQPTKGKKVVLFSTKGNAQTRENIINVFGAKTMQALVPLDLTLELKPTTSSLITGTPNKKDTNKVHIVGHVSRPAHGEGRQTPDRQMFYVNGRPCGLPQFAKVFNEVYRSYNSSQSPFILADVQLDTHMYDVNVSPDKRTILLHDQGPMLEKLKEALAELFANQDYTVPVAQLWSTRKTPGSALRSDSPVTPSRSSPRAGRSLSSLRNFTSTAEPETDTPTRQTSMLRNQTNLQTQEEDDDDNDELKENQTLDTSNTSTSLASFSANATKPFAQPTLNQFVNRVTTKENTSVPKCKITTAAEILQEQPQDVGEAEAEFELEDDTQPPPPQTVFTHSERTTVKSTSKPDIENEEDDEDDGMFVRQPDPAPEPEPEPEESDEDSETVIHAVAKKTYGSSAPLVRVGGHYQRPSDVAIISIGGSTVTRNIGRNSGLGSTGRSIPGSLGTRSSSRTSSLPQRSKGKPSFGGRLAEMFASQSGKDKGTAEDDSEDEIEYDDEAEDVEEEEHDNEQTEETISREQSDRKQVKLPPFKPPVRTSSRKRAAESDPESGDEVEPTPDEDGDIELSNAPVPMDATATEPDEETPRPPVVPKLFMETPGLDISTSARKAPKKDATVNLVQTLKTSEDAIASRISALQTALAPFQAAETAEPVNNNDVGADGLEASNAEEKLSLTISKGDFGRMKIVGQFNLGFILAVRPAVVADDEQVPGGEERNDEVFIIDQHATDEKYNFERLQATTIVQSQRLVNPKTLELTALEEEIVIENKAALEANGFDVAVDMSGDVPVGSRCQLLALPLSRETTFTLTDLEELISLLGDHQSSITTTTAFSSFSAPSASFGEAAKRLTAIPRPGKVRKMFAMRACRSSVMIGKALTQGKMETLVRHMGELDKPWNCPHGRPTMRHLCGLGTWEERGWKEMEGPTGWGEEEEFTWGDYLSEE